MKKLLTLGVAGILALQQAVALEVNLTRTSGYAQSPGGEFTVTSVSPDPAFDSIFNDYASVATLNGGFQTFCLGLTTELLGNPQLGTLTPSGVAAGTALLYSEFAKGTLPGYSYVPGSTRTASAGQLQAAIWYFQGFSQAQINGYFGSPLFDPTTDIFVIAAEAALGGLSGATAPNNGGFGVDALDLTDLTGAVSQPMLALVPQSTGTPLEHGDAATIGFWHNKNGQALIECVNGGPDSTELGTWLGSHFGCLFGNLNGQPNTAVAAQFLTYFGVQGEKTYAQIMGGALACYVTSSTLAGGDCASAYGFNLSIGGTGAKLFDVGSNGSAIGLSNNTSYTILQLLEAANANCSGGIISPPAFDALNNIFDEINSSADIQ